MSAWIAALLSQIFKNLLAELWKQASEEVRERLAEGLLEKHIAKYNARFLDSTIMVDRLIEAQGKPLTKEQKDEIRKERVALELGLWNTRP